MSLGKSIPHDTAGLHVTGQARYIDDIPTPSNCLHLAFGTSPHARAEITAVNLDPVRAAEGVVAVYSATDFIEKGGVPDCSPSISDEPLLAEKDVYFAGQPVFFVVATSHLLARQAARLGDISYDVKAPILSYEDALAAKSHFEDGPRIYQKGDAATAIDTAAHKVSGTINMGGQEHFYLESQASLVVPSENGDMTVHASTQHPTEIQHKVSHALHIPMHSVRVEMRRMGGGFGGKESQGNALAIACAIAARDTGRPCKMRYDRDDDMTITGKRHDFRISYSCGFDDTGAIQGVDFLQLTRGGWSLDLTLPVADRAMLHADNAYHLPHVRIESLRLKTNIQSATAYRGFGGPQGILGIERVIDHIAHHLGMDPSEVRRVNYYAEMGEDPETTPYGMAVEDCILPAMSEQLLRTSDYKIRQQNIADWNAENTVLKKGIGISPVKFGISFTLTHLNQAGALVHLYQDGSIHLNHGGTEMGQGLFQKIAQVAASSFGVGLDQIKITATDTEKVPNTSATAASSGTDLNGMAVLNACEKLKSRLAEFLHNTHGDAPEEKDIEWQSGQLSWANRSLPFAEVVKQAYENRISLSATGFYKTPDIKWDRIKGQGRPFFYFAYGLAITEVVIDTLTGENRILRTDILHDAGQSINPALDIGQVEGGYVQGAGWLTTEELIWDDKGILKTHAPSTYKIPTASDAPDIFNVTLWDQPNKMQTIYRSKAVGEPPFVLGISAFLALSNAVSACGARYPDLQAPATAEEILGAIERTQT